MVQLFMRTEYIKINPNNPEKEIIKKAAKIIKKGGLVGFPTETVYGIAADATNPRAIAKLTKAKQRPAGKPYTLQIADKKDITKFAKNISPPARKIIKKHWPGPLTLILPSRNGGKIGLRIPDHQVALSLIKAVGKPIVAPSANISGQQSLGNAKEIYQELNGVLDLILDGGPARYGQESTIVDFTVAPPQVVRQGALDVKI